MQITIQHTLLRIMKPALLVAAIATTCLQPATAQDNGTTDPSTPAVPPLPEALITNPSQLHSNAHNTTNSIGASDKDLANLIDNSDKTIDYSYWISDTEGTCTEPQYLRVDLGDGFSLDDDEDIVVYIARHHKDGAPTNLNIENFGKKLHPTAFHVEVSNDNKTWEPFAEPDTYVYFTYRGPSTKEFSTRIHTNKTFRYIRFTVTANNSKTLNKGTEYRSMCLSHFQLLKVKKDSNAIYFYNTEPGKELYLTDRFHLNTDLRPDYADYEFVNTRGIFDLHKLDRYNTEDIPNDFCDWDNCWDENGIWKKDLLTLSKYGIDMPKYSWVTGDEDPLIKEGKRQRTHVIEHTYYAVPGDAVALVPYYEMPTVVPNKYDVTYAHWYDYKTGGHLKDSNGNRLLDFLVDPRDIYYSNKYGYFAGLGFPREKHYDIAEPRGTGTMVINSVQDFIDFVAKVNSDEGNHKNINLSAVINTDLDFSGIDGSKLQIKGTNWNPYCGTIDGQGHVISNMNISTSGESASFISHLGASVRDNKLCIGALKNIIFDETCSFKSTGYNAVASLVSIGSRPAGSNATIRLEGIINKANVSSIGSNDNTKVSGLLGEHQTDEYGTGTELVPAEVVRCASMGQLSAEGTAQPEVAQLVLDAQDVTITDSWSVATATTKISSGSEVTEISTVEEFNAFATRTQSNKYLSARIIADLDFEGKEFIPIGASNTEFYGTIDGQGHVISNLKVSGKGTVAFITRLDIEDQNVGCLKDIIFDESCSFEATKNDVSESNVDNNAVAAIVGSIGYRYNSEESVLVEGVVNRAKMTADNARSGYSKVSGLIGTHRQSSSAPVKVVKCASTGALYAKGTTPEAAQLVLDADNTTIIDCWSAATAAIETVSTSEVEEIDNARYFVEYTQNHPNESVKLTADLDFDGVEFKGLGLNQWNAYKGSIDGQGHVIKNLKYVVNESSSCGFINYWSANGSTSLKNITFDESCEFTITGMYNWPYQISAGIIANIAGSGALSIEGVVSKAKFILKTVNGNVTVYSAGLVGNNIDNTPLNINNCGIAGSIAIESHDPSKVNSAMFVQNSNNTTISNSWSVCEGTVKNLIDNTTSAFNNFYKSGTPSITNCYSNGELSADIIKADENLNTLEFVTKLNNGSTDGPWAVSPETGDGPHYPYVIFREGVAVVVPAKLYLNRTDKTTVTNTYSIYGDKSGADVMQSPTTAEEMNTNTWVPELNKGIWADYLPKWAVSTDVAGKGRGAHPFPYVFYERQEEQETAVPFPLYLNGDATNVNNVYSLFGSEAGAGIQQTPELPDQPETAILMNEATFATALNKNADISNGYSWDVSVEGGKGATMFPYPYIKYAFASELFDDAPGRWVWKNADGSVDYTSSVSSFYSRQLSKTSGSGNPGTYATFFYPRDPYVKDGGQTDLPEEYVIAADFSVSFNVAQVGNNSNENTLDANLNIDYLHRKIYEPELCYRHIFHVKDGRNFADEFSGSKEANDKYVTKTRRYITAPAGIHFTVRLDAGMPVANTGNWDARSRFYYKISDSDYRRVAGCNVETYKVDENGNETKVDNMFKLDREVNLVGSRTLDGVPDSPTYYACGGNELVYRVLSLDSHLSQKGKYKVRLVAKDVNDQIIHPYGNDTDPLIVREFVVEFTDSNQGYVCPEDQLEFNSVGTEAALNEKFGAAYTTIDCDEYLAFNNLIGDASGFPVSDYIFHPWKERFGGGGDKTNGENYYALKWPLPRQECEYGSTLGRGHNYCLYRIAQHSSVVEWKGAVNSRPSNKNFDVTSGLFDRHFYESGYKIKQDMAAALAEGKEYTGPTKPEPGYFYWVNASSDPGVSCRLNVGRLCHGATLHVSAWIADFSGSNDGDNALANVSFNFVAVMTDGSINRIHSFITGPIGQGETAGKWNKVYYNFTPELDNLDIDRSLIDHYEIELDNNASSSEGADYAIDKVQVYIMHADVKAQQLNFPCADQNSVIDMKVYAPFDNLIRMIDLTPAENASTAKPVNMYYSFVNKALFDKLIAEGKTTDQAYDQAVVKGCYGNERGTVTDANRTFGKLTFDTFYGNLKAYSNGEDGNPMEYNVPMGYEDPNTKIKYFAFNSWVKDANMHVGNQYYVLLFNDPTGAENFEPSAADFDIGNDCSSKSTIEIEGNSKIKVDGYPIGSNPSLQRCENESPVIQLDLVGLKVGDSKYDSVIKNAAFDWYNGQLADFYLESNEDGSVMLFEALARFRESYPDATSAIQECTEQYTEADREYLVSVTTSHDGQAPKLYLYQHSFIYPDTHIPEGMDSYDYYVSAIPCISKLDMDGYTEVCIQPVEIKLTVDKHTPRMKTGLTDIASYPDYLNDAPLRTGLNQIRKTMATKAESTGAEYTLDFPIRFVSSTIKDVTKMVIKESKDNNGNTVRDDEVYLMQTNDPEYTNLYPEDDEAGLWAVGRLVELKADVSDGNVKENMARIVFYKNDPTDTETKALNFKEGYYYRFAVPYMEEILEGVDYVPACPGRQIVTLKIVPEYMRWAGTNESLNWNNDLYWERVDTKGLYADVADKTNDNNLNDFVTDGSNGMTCSYSPAPFTKVILPAVSSTLKDDKDEPLGIENPYLYRTENQQISIYTREGSKDMTWTANPEDTDPESPAGASGNLVDQMKKSASLDINYDMVAFEGKNFLGCGPWQAHVCDQIDFMPKAGITNQQYLTYNKAWVEVEMTPGRWYTLSSPLQATLAGDMYMPTVNSRQETLRFRDITYDTKLNNRFAPAVFQRNWDAANATLYKLPAADGGNGEQVDVAVETNWSHVFNDVKEEYRPGEGFSIYSDVSDVTEQPENVLMRLPKADTEWYYYDINWKGDENGNTTDGIHGDKTSVTRTDANYRLNSLEDGVSGTMTGTAAGNSRYYLFGNPFMAPLDMAKLLKANSDKIGSTYWIMSGDNYTAAVVDEKLGDHIFTNAMDEDGAKVSPLQGFFVKLKAGYDAPDNKLELTYDNNMILRTAAGGNPIRKPGTRSGSLSRSEAEAEARGLVLEALRNDTVLSRSLIVTDMNATSGYGDEDAPLMIDRQLVTAPLVYSLAGHQAAVINVTDDIDGTGIGLVNDDPAETLTIRLSNVADAEDCLLTDLTTGESEPIYEGMEIPVTGGSNGRYYITRGGAQDKIQAIRIERSGNTVTVSTGRQGIAVDVFDTLGVHTASYQTDEPQVSFTLPAGVYVLKADDGTERKTAKLIIR